MRPVSVKNSAEIIIAGDTELGLLPATLVHCVVLEHQYQQLCPQQRTVSQLQLGDFLTSFSFAVSWAVLFCISSFSLSSPSSSSGCSSRAFCFSLAGVRGGVCVVKTWSRKQASDEKQIWAFSLLYILFTQHSLKVIFATCTAEDTGAELVITGLSLL